MKLVEQTPDLGRCWIRYAFRPWPGISRLWLDLFTRSLGPESSGEGVAFESPLSTALDDVAYLPPVIAAHEDRRGELARRLAEEGTPVLVESLPGAILEIAGISQTFDVLHSVATGNIRELELIPEGSAVVWPLITGYTDDEVIWEEGLSCLVGRGVSGVQGVAADLTPADKRRIVDVAGETGFDKLFHGIMPSEREFSKAVDRSGMDPLFPRPLPSQPTRLTHNRQVAGVLASIGELWLRLGKAEARGQVFYRDARWVDREKHDLVTLAREGNLGVVDWLDDASRQVIHEVADGGDSSLLTELRAEYLG